MGVKVHLPPAKPEANMCFGCNVRCCTLRIDLTVYDIARLASASRAPIPDFLVYTDAPAGDRFGFRSSGKLLKFVLAKKKDGLCVFFDGKGDLYCTIEDAKPSACLAYPMALTREGVPVVREDVMCPKENLKRADFNKMSKAVLEDYVWERDRHAEFVADWNMCAKGDEPPEEFLRFAASELDLERVPWGRLVRYLKRKLLRLRP